MLKRSLLRTIKGSIGRFLAIFSIIALGVGFYAGLKVTRESMVKTADGYFRELGLFDFRLVSTLGLTEADVEVFSAVDGVKKAVGSVSADFIFTNDGGNNAVYHAHELTDGMNGVELVSGAMPQSPDECLLDAKFAGEDSIGTEIVLSSVNSEDTFDIFAYDSYTVTGLINAAYYVNFERGSTSLGNGDVAGFVYLPHEGFSADYYTEIFLSVDTDAEIYSDEYEELTDGMTDGFEELLEERADIRYSDIVDEAQQEIDEAREKVDDADLEMEDAQKELDDGKKKLADGKTELEDAKKELEDGKKELADAEKELKDKRKEAEDAQEKINDGWEQYHKEYDAAAEAFAKAEAELKENLAALDEARAQYEAAIPFMHPEAAAAAEAELAGKEALLSRAEAQYEAEYAAAMAAFEVAEQELIDGQEELDEGYEKIEDGEREIEDARRELEDGEKKVGDAEKKIADSEKEIEDGEAELADAKKKVEDARIEVEDAQKELDELEEATVFVLDRSTNIGYASLDNDAEIVNGIAKVFPLFFFLVAALVCITTMTRMVSEKRTENGVLKALGYSDAAIIGQYLVYAGSASAAGCTAGFLLGSKFLPYTIWEIYHIMYAIERPCVYIVDLRLFAMCSALYLFCALGATLLVCRRDLRESAAQLIRPKVPTSGRRILLERVTFLWRRLPFLHKVSVRNIIRYRRRMIMMITGIGGCTALLLTGFGIRDSIQPILDYQFDQISVFDASVYFLDEPDRETLDEFEEEAVQNASVYAYVYSESADLDTGDGIVSVELIVNDGDLSPFWDIHCGSEALPVPGPGEALIDYRVADQYGVEVGDELELTDNDLRSLTVKIAGIYDNYLYDYLFVSSETVATQWDSVPAANMAYVNFLPERDAHEAGAAFLAVDGVGSVSINEDMMTRVGNMLESHDYVVLIVLVCAGALSFIVVYNLTNITITERSREVATLKVLGFYRNEQNSYIFRENIILTVISAVCGIPMGIALLRYVMSQIKINSMYFGCTLLPGSYIWALVITFAFTLAVDLALTGKLARVNMAEAMKAIE